MPDLGFLFGGERQASIVRAAAVTPTPSKPGQPEHPISFRRALTQHPSKPRTPFLDLALQNSARSSLDSHRTSPLIETSPISFAPAMSAPPGGYSYVNTVHSGSLQADPLSAASTSMILPSSPWSISSRMSFPPLVYVSSRLAPISMICCAGSDVYTTGTKPYRLAPDCRRRISVEWKEFGA